MQPDSVSNFRHGLSHLGYGNRLLCVHCFPLSRVACVVLNSPKVETTQPTDLSSILLISYASDQQLNAHLGKYVTPGGRPMPAVAFRGNDAVASNVVAVEIFN